MADKRIFHRRFAVLILAVIAAAAAAAITFADRLSLQQVKALIDSFGGMAPAVFVLLCVLRGLVLLPCGLLSALGGMLFGPLIGTGMTLVGLTAGSVITFYLARILGTNWAQRILKHRYDKYEGYVSKNAFWKILLMRVMPVLPFDAVSCIAGISRAGVIEYIFATLAGSLPGVFIYVFFGDSVRNLSIKRMAFSFAIIAILAVSPFLYGHLSKLIKKTA